jgi:TonB family protein
MSKRDPLHIRGAYSLIGFKTLPVSGRRHPLEREASRYFVTGALIAVTFGAAMFGIWQYLTHRTPEDDSERTVAIVRYSELGVPPSIDRGTNAVNMATQVAVAAPPTIAVPEPVPDELAMEQTMMTQEEVNLALQAATQTDLGDIGGGVIDDRVVDKTGGEEFKTSVNVLPVMLSRKKPDYPSMARAAGIQGTVIVNVYVGKDGRVIKGKVVEGPLPLRDAALASALTALFKPATTDKRPVAVWVAMPMRFSLGK